MKRSKLRGFIRCLFFALLLMSLGVTAFAVWKARSFTYNRVTTPAFGTNIIEDYNPPKEGMFPGTSVDKVVQLRNEGETTSIVRVQLEKRIGDYVDDVFIDDKALDINNISLVTNDKDWHLHEDGWYYYSEPLVGGQLTTPLLYSFNLSKDVGNEYEKKHIQIVVNAESVQYLNDGPKLWDTSYADLGMEEPTEEYEMRDTSVTFLDPIRKFDIEVSRTDLFHNFKDLLPGSARTQRIHVSNDYNDDVSLHLVAMDVDGNSGIKDPLVKDLLYKFVTVRVQDSKGKRIYEGPVRGNGEVDIPLGDYAHGEGSDLLVRLKVDSEMTSEYSNLMGQVKWAFEAREIEKAVSLKEVKDQPKILAKQKLVQTSDIRLLYLGIFLSFVGIMGVVILRKKKKEVM